MEGEEALALP